MSWKVALLKSPEVIWGMVSTAAAVGSICGNTHSLFYISLELLVCFNLLPLLCSRLLSLGGAAGDAGNAMRLRDFGQAFLLLLPLVNIALTMSRSCYRRDKRPDG